MRNGCNMLAGWFFGHWRRNEIAKHFVAFRSAIDDEANIAGDGVVVLACFFPIEVAIYPFTIVGHCVNVGQFAVFIRGVQFEFAFFSQQ